MRITHRPDVMRMRLYLRFTRAAISPHAASPPPRERGKARLGPERIADAAFRAAKSPLSTLRGVLGRFWASWPA